MFFVELLKNDMVFCAFIRLPYFMIFSLGDNTSRISYTSTTISYIYSVRYIYTLAYDCILPPSAQNYS